MCKKGREYPLITDFSTIRTADPEEAGHQAQSHDDDQLPPPPPKNPEKASETENKPKNLESWRWRRDPPLPPHPRTQTTNNLQQTPKPHTQANHQIKHPT